jgi:hypothetical protein
MNPHDIRAAARLAMKAGLRTLAELHVAADIASRGECTLGSIAISTGMALESAAYAASITGNAGLTTCRNTKGSPNDILIAPTPKLKDLFDTARALATLPPLRAKHLSPSQKP